MTAQMYMDPVQKAEQLLSERFDLGDYKGRCYKSVYEFPPESLRQVTKGQSFWASIEWLAYVEQMPNVRMLYLAAEDGEGRLAGLLPCQLVTDSSGLLFYNIPRSLVEGGNFGNPEMLNHSQRLELEQSQAQLASQSQDLYPSLIAATPNSYCALTVDPNLIGEERQAVIDALIQLFERCAHRLGSRSHGLFYIQEKLQVDVARSLPDQYVEVRMGADAVLPVLWQSFEEYLQIFNDHRRNTIRRERKSFAKAGLEVRISYGAEGLTDDLIQLQLSLRAKYGHGGDPYQLRKSFAAMREILADRIRVFTAVCKGETLGFVLFFEHENVLYSHVAGFDYQKLGKVFCYPNIVIYEPLIYAIKQGITRIHYGLSAYEGKVRRGCVLHDLRGFLTVKSELGPFIRHVSTLLSYSEEQQLNYFRDMIVQSF